MSKPTAWMPMYWGDYLRDTAHLSVEEHGAYLLLIAHYWNTGKPLPADEKYLQNILQLSSFKMKKYLPVLATFFTIENGKWHHARIERELTVAFNNKEAARANGRRGAAVRWKGQTGMATPMPEQWGGYSSSPPPIMNHESDLTTSTDAARDPALHGGSGPRASRPETSKERLLRLAIEHRKQSLRKGQA